MSSVPPPRLDPRALGEELPPRRGPMVAALLIATVALIWLGNVAARSYLFAESTNRGYRIVHTKWQMLEALDHPVDWLILGDSTGAHGIQPEAWSAVMGGEAINLAVIGHVLAINDAWMLERYIERFGPPKGVLVVHAHDIWARQGKAVLLGQIDQPWGFWDEQPAWEPSVDDVETIALARHLPLYADNQELRKHLWAHGQPWDPRLQISDSGWIHGRAHMPSALNRDRTRLARHLRSTTGFRISRRNRVGLQHLGRLSSTHEFPIYLTHAPLWSGITRLNDFKRYDRDRNRRLGVIADVWRNVVLLPETLTYEFSDFEGHLDHVTPAVAPRHTRRVAEAVKARFDRWRPRKKKAKPGG